MEATRPLDQMSVAEKLRVMEMLSADMSRNEAQLESPAKQGSVLRDREAKVKSGQKSFLDWETAKRQLRAKLT